MPAGDGGGSAPEAEDGDADLADAEAGGSGSDGEAEGGSGDEGGGRQQAGAAAGAAVVEAEAEASIADTGRLFVRNLPYTGGPGEQGRAAAGCATCVLAWGVSATERHAALLPASPPSPQPSPCLPPGPLTHPLCLCCSQRGRPAAAV